MPERPSVTMRLEPRTLSRLDALAVKLGLSRTAVVHLAVAKLAQLEGVADEPK